MAATIPTMAMLSPKCMSTNSPNKLNPSKPAIKPIPLLSLQNLPKGLSVSNLSSSLTGTAIAGAVFSTLSSCEAAYAVQQIADIAEGDNRGSFLLIPLVPAVLWVLFNILQPALNQLNRMRSSNGVILGLGLGGLAASGFLSTPSASAVEEIASLAAEATNDNRGTLLLLVISPAIAWVLFNILQPALNQINKMRSD